MNNEELLETYTSNLASTGSNRNSYIKHAQLFLDYAGIQMDKATINRYIERMRKKGYSDGTVNFAFRVIRTLFTRNKLDWPFNRGEAPQIRENKVTAPALHPDVIIEMIEAVKKNGQPDETALLALSTTYGLRRIEMVQLTSEDISIRDRVIHIATAKHGRERNHMLPKQIIPYIEGYDFDTSRSQFGLFTTWYKLEYKIGMEHSNQVGWHSIRRTVNTILLDHFPDTVVSSFLRWKQRTSSSMPYRYSAQSYVGKEGVSTKVVGEAIEVDQKVFKKHPFLKYWGVKC